jgi:anti-sigma regulatory factor (Ser/Thr protein kinase)
MTARETTTSQESRSGNPEPEGSVSARFPADLRSPRAARHFVSDVMQAWELSQVAREEAALVATELAANAVLHADSGFSVLVVAGAGVVRIAVHDAVPIDPALLVVRPSRGLGLVAAVSRDWGVDVTTRGKTVWAEIDAIFRG